MKSFSKNDWAHMHDCILHATWETTKKSCRQEELEQIFESLPSMLKAEADEWGMNDTLWRDKFIGWYEENILNKK